jgi:hypothetical protein
MDELLKADASRHESDMSNRVRVDLESDLKVREED